MPRRVLSLMHHCLDARFNSEPRGLGLPTITDYHALPAELSKALRKHLVAGDHVKIGDIRAESLTYKSPHDASDSKTVSIAPARSNAPVPSGPAEYATSFILWACCLLAMYPNQAAVLTVEIFKLLDRMLHEYDAVSPLGVALIDDEVRRFALDHRLAPFPVSPSLSEKISMIRLKHAKIDAQLCHTCNRPDHYAIDCPLTRGLALPVHTAARSIRKPANSAGPPAHSSGFSAANSAGPPAHSSRFSAAAPPLYTRTSSKPHADRPAVPNSCRNYNRGIGCYLPAGKTECSKQHNCVACGAKHPFVAFRAADDLHKRHNAGF